MRGNWSEGKRYKGDGEERAYAKAEIAQFLREMDENYQTTYKKSKRSRNEKARLLHRIEWCRAALARHKDASGSSGWFVKWIRADLEQALKKYQEKFL